MDIDDIRRQNRVRLPMKLTYIEDAFEEQQKTIIAKQLQLYTKRNLSKAEVLRTVSGTAASSTASDPAFRTSSIAIPRTAPSIKVHYRDGRTSDSLIEGPPSILFTAATMAPPEAPKGSPEFQKVVKSIERIFVQQRAKEVESMVERKELNDTLSMLSFNQARLEEESNRRQESANMASQTGKTCHKIIRPITAPDLQSELQAVQSGRPYTTEGGLKAARIETTTPQKHHRIGPLGLSLSPYDNVDQETESPAMRLFSRNSRRQQERINLITPDTSKKDRWESLGLSNTHPTALRATSLFNTTLDVSPTAETLFAPSQRVLPSLPAPAAAENADEKGPPTKQPARPRKPSEKGKPKDPKKKVRRSGPVDPDIISKIFPTLSVEQEVPSLLRVQQLRLVEAIRESFAKQGLSLPTSIIENGILTPEDRPYEECITNLPAPELGLVMDYTKSPQM